MMGIQVRLRSLASSRPFIAIRGILYALIAGVLGWQLGQALMSPSSTLVASPILMGVCILVTLKYPLTGLLLTLILHPFDDFFYLMIDLGAGIPDITLARVTVAIAFALIMVRGATGRRPFSRLTGVDVSMGLATIGLGIAAVRGTSITTDLQWLLDMYLIPYIIYYVTKNLTTDRSRLQRILLALAFIGAYCGVYGIYTVTTGNVLFRGSGHLGSLWYDGLHAMRGLLGSPYTFGLVFSLAIPVDFYLLIKAQSQRKRLLYALTLAVTLGGLFFTYKRTAWIAAMVSLLVIQFFFPRFRRLFLVLLVLAVGVMMLYWDQISESPVVTDRIGRKVDSLNGRLEYWNAVLEEWKRNPILGYGFGGFYARSSYRAIESNYLWILVDGGLVGFVSFILVLVLLLKTSIRLYRTRAPAIFVEPDLVAVFLGVLVAYVISLSTVVMNHEFPHTLFFLLAGAVVGSQEVILGQQPNRQPKVVKVEKTQVC
jgi:O-antigen ligase